jgi:hypothetical protein
LHVATTKDTNMFGKITRYFELVGKARAAVELSRMGYHQEAKKLMLK